jgi:glycerol kinase
MQIQADVLQRPVVRSAVAETTALGAAYLAGLAVGFWRDRDEIAGNAAAGGRRSGGRFEPRMPAPERDALVQGWHRAVERAKGWAT